MRTLRRRLIAILATAACTGCSALPWEENPTAQVTSRSITAERLDLEVERNLAASKLRQTELALASYTGQQQPATGIASENGRLTPFANFPISGERISAGVPPRQAGYATATAMTDPQQRERALQVAGLLTKLVEEDNPGVAPLRELTPRTAVVTPARRTVVAQAGPPPLTGDQPASSESDLSALLAEIQTLTQRVEAADRATSPPAPPVEQLSAVEVPVSHELQAMRRQLQQLLMRIDQLSPGATTPHQAPLLRGASADSATGLPADVEATPGPARQAASPADLNDLRQALARLTVELQQQGVGQDPSRSASGPFPAATVSATMTERQFGTATRRAALARLPRVRTDAASANSPAIR